MERERLEVDVLFVGAGPACLAGALHLSRLLRKHNEAVQSGVKTGGKLEDLTILVIDKGKRIGSHALSGAVVDPRGFDELLEGFSGQEPPYDAPVGDDALFLLTRSGSLRFPITPPPLRNHGYFVASLGKLVEWMAELCEENGVDVYPEFPGVELLYDNDGVIGVRTGDRGRDSDGKPKANFEPGVDVRAKITVLGEGPRGTLTGLAVRQLGLQEGRQPQVYAAGVKEIWEVPGDLEPGLVYHTMGYPLGTQAFGGGFLYTMRDNLIDVGFVTGLDYENPHLDGHRLLQQFKTHPFVKDLLEGGKPVAYGAKTIPEGGYYSMPRTYSDGLLIVGDSAGYLNAQRLKGIHLAIKSGMMAAETIFDALVARDFSSKVLKAYEDRFERSWARRELWKVRNFRQAFQRGYWSGLVHAGLQFVTGGRGVRDPLPISAGHTHMKQLKDFFGELPVKPERMNFDGRLTLDKLGAVYLSDTDHEEDQPCHLKILDFDICHNRCPTEYGNPCQYFCPAQVYEMVSDESRGRTKLQVNFTNCVHCKTCDIMDPYQIIVWTPPEGGGGPDWKNM